MPTVEEITERYRNYSDEELVAVYSQIGGYTPEAQAAFQQVVEEKGGIASLKERIENQLKDDYEITRVRFQVNKLLKQGKTPFELKDIIKLERLSTAQLETIIDEESIVLEHEKIDRQIKPRTIWGGILGSFIGGTIGGIAWGLQMVYSKHMFLIFAVGLALLCYGVIRLFTRQSNKNTAVVVMTVISVVYALILGQIIFEIYGSVGQ